MDFTREPIIETVITSREGCALVVRSSKGSGQEEFFVDALEVVIFGNAIFFRSRERPKAFLVPATDYEVLEVRETRLVLKNVGLDRSIKIAGGREASLRTNREPAAKIEIQEQPAEIQPVVHPEGAPHLASPQENSAADSQAKPENRLDKKRDRRRNYRRRRGREDEIKSESGGTHVNVPEGDSIELPPPELSQEEIAASASAPPVVAVLTSLLAPPPNLISETIARYKDNALFKGAFFLKEDDEDLDENDAEELESDDQYSEVDSDAEEIVRPREGRNLFGEEHESTAQKPEDSSLELPNMSLDYPVYVPLDRTVGEEPISLLPEKSFHSSEPQTEAERIEEMRSEVLSEESALDGPPVVESDNIESLLPSEEVPVEIVPQESDAQQEGLIKHEEDQS